MSRYIDADALIKKEERYELDRYIDGERCYEMAVPSCAIIEAPSIDIVRCKECKFSARYVDDGHIECRLYSHPLRHDYHEMKPDDFCSYGEREGE